MINKNIEERKLMGRIGLPEEEWGPIIGFWATTYEFEPDFFETDYLPNLLNLGSWNDRHWTTRITLEKELFKMESATVMMDALCYQGRPRSLRIAVLATRAQKQTKLHAKVMVICHEEAVRLIVGSANITEPGYRHNIEVIANYVATKKNTADAPLIKSALLAARIPLSPWWSKTVDDLTTKCLKWLDELRVDKNKDRSDSFVWSGGQIPLWRQVLDRWGSEPVRKIIITSPFWSEETGAGPLSFFIRKMKERNVISDTTEVTLLAMGRQESIDAWRPELPLSYGAYNFSRLGIRCYAQSVDPNASLEEAGGVENKYQRQLHAKVFLMEGDNTTLAYLGSANFTHKGWGTALRPHFANVEAGVIAVRKGKQRSELSALVPAVVGQKIELDGNESDQLKEPIKQENIVPWPDFIHSIYLEISKTDANALNLVVETTPSKIYGMWQILYSNDEGFNSREPLLRFDGIGRQRKLVIRRLSESELKRLVIDQEVLVSWWEYLQGIVYPINVSQAAREKLPISPESQGPNEQMLLAYYQGRIPYEELFPPVEPESLINGNRESNLEGLSYVDVSKIQSYQIREFVESLDGIREDLKLASASERTMRVALFGPVSPVALASMILANVKTKKRTPVAAGFQLVELLACIMSVSRLNERKLWAKHQVRAIKDISAKLDALSKEFPSDLGPSSTFAKYKRRILKAVS